MNTPETACPIPTHDYSTALKGAVAWLGERYLLADPVPRRIDQRKPFFTTPRSWHPHAARA